MSDAIVHALIASVTVAAILAGAWIPRMRQLEQQNRELLGTVLELSHKLASRDPSEYRAWTAPPFDQDPPIEPRLYDETGLLMVPLEDRLED